MRRVAWVALLVALAGCSDAGEPTSGDTPSAGDDIQDDYNVEPTATTGVLLGVVVDEAIRPVKDIKVAINLPDGSPLTKTSDTEGRFAFGDLDPGVYLIQFTNPQFATLSSSVEVKAGEEDPPVHRFQVERLFAQEPYTEMIQYDGYIACAYAFQLSSTCVNDYTRIIGCLSPAACVCPGGCFREQELAAAGGNRREYVSVINEGWQSIIIEATWDPTSDLGEQLGFTVSYYARPTTSHWYGGTGGPAPLRIQFDVGVEHESVGDPEPKLIPENGTEELFTFFSANQNGLTGPGVAVNQAFTAFQTVYYYAIPEEGWSFIVNGAPPF